MSIALRHPSFSRRSNLLAVWALVLIGGLINGACVPEAGPGQDDETDETGTVDDQAELASTCAEYCSELTACAGEYASQCTSDCVSGWSFVDRLNAACKPEYTEFVACVATDACMDEATDISQLCPTELEAFVACDHANPFVCADGVEVAGSAYCNTHAECADGSDELDCPPDLVFACDDGETIFAQERCDGVPQCADDSDESNC